MKIIISGSTSKLGVRLVQLANLKNYEILSFNLQEPYYKEQLDILNQEKVDKVITSFSPDILIHTAGFVNADKCENERKKSFNVNIDGTCNLAKSCAKVGAKFLNISSDYVFDGKNGPYDENDQTNPINVYGIAKYKTENLLVEHCPNSITIRTCLLYDWNHEPRRENFLIWLINRLEKREGVRIVNDQYSTPTFIPQLVKVIFYLMKTKYKGIINVSGSEWINRYKFSMIAAKIFNLDNSLIEEIDSNDLNQTAKRPSLGGLKIDKIQDQFYEKILGVKEGLKLCKKIKEDQFRIIDYFNQ